MRGWAVSRLVEESWRVACAGSLPSEGGIPVSYRPLGQSPARYLANSIRSSKLQCRRHGRLCAWRWQLRHQWHTFPCDRQPARCSDSDCLGYFSYVAWVPDTFQPSDLFKLLVRPDLCDIDIAVQIGSESVHPISFA